MFLKLIILLIFVIFLDILQVCSLNTTKSPLNISMTVFKNRIKGKLNADTHLLAENAEKQNLADKSSSSSSNRRFENKEILFKNNENKIKQNSYLTTTNKVRIYTVPCKCVGYIEFLEYLVI